MKLIQDLQDCADVSLVGGKAVNLGMLLRAGFIVPHGFAVTTAADDAATETICEAYRKLGAPTIAVRSSATIEDSAQTSMAGQFKTVLNVRSESELIDAIALCRGSSQKDRVRAYRDAHGCSSAESAMAVVIQRQIVPDVAGILFTSDPQHPDEMLIEANRGLGDDVVSGRVQPDRYRIEAATGRLLESHATSNQPCLTRGKLRKLWELGRNLATHFGRPQDVEWGIVDGDVFLLQTRPVTTGDTEALRTSLITAAREELQRCGGGPWVLHNLAETLPHPTPLTWSVLRKFMAGDGGFGSIYRRVGFDPLPGEFLELVLGRIYMDLSRAPKLFGKHFPFEYDTEILRRDPSAAALLPGISHGSLGQRLRAVKRIARARRRIEGEAADFDQRLKQTSIPDFVAWCRREKDRDVARLEPEGWINLWRQRERRIFDEFAPQILFTNFITSLALTTLRDFLSDHFWNDEPDQLADSLASAGSPDWSLIGNTQLREVVEGKRTVETWLAEHGHRAIGEFDLASPRWREMPDRLAGYAEHLKNGRDPLERHREIQRETDNRLAQLPVDAVNRARGLIDQAQRYLAFREDGKHYLMLGYDLLRDLALDASRRLDADVFYLTFDELVEALRTGRVPHAQIDNRKAEHRLTKRMPLPHFIDANVLPLLGQPPRVEDRDHFRGLSISSGFASGPVRIVDSPLDAHELGTGYVLVCPSTDPEWTPLFVNAAALVMECGGTLSHGAIVARELCIPAVVLPGATRLLPEGEQLFVDGSHGIVALHQISDRLPADDLSISAEKKPPGIGVRERRAARLRNIGFAFWSVYLAGAWMLPQDWIYQPSLHALDRVLWPIVLAIGKPAAVLITAAGLAAIAALVQARCVDNVRLREAQRRMRNLREEMKTLPPGSPRYETIRSIDKSLRKRLMGASFVCAGILLGVFLMTFAWLSGRMETVNPPPGSAARIVTTVDSDFRGPITVKVDPPLRLDQASDASRSLPPIRETLERLSSQPTTSASDAADIRRYLRKGVPPQTLAWIVHSDVAGQFPIELAVGEKISIQQRVVFGEQSPPPDQQNFHDRKSSFRSIKVELAAVRDAGAGIGWPWIYLAGYLPTWLLLRRLLRLV